MSKMKKQHKTNYFCEHCFKTYSQYWDSSFKNDKNKNNGFHDGNGNPITKIWGKCDNCKNGVLKVC